MGHRVRTVATELWCKDKNIEIDKEILERDVRGVYGFFIDLPQGEECVYIGKAINIRYRMYEHFSFVKFNSMELLAEEASEHIKRLTNAINNKYKIKVKLLKSVKYEGDNYNRDLHRLAFAEYCFIEKYQRMGQCLHQRQEGYFNEQEYNVWLDTYCRNDT